MNSRPVTNWIVLLIAILISTTTLANLILADEVQDFSEPKRVLLISSYSPSFQTFFDQIEGVEEAFGDENIIFDVEFMDSKRLFTDENMANFHQSLTYKLNQLEPYDLILSSDDNAANYVMANKAILFPDTPFVFFGVNNRNNATVMAQDPMVTGVLEASSIKETIVVAKRLQPKANRVVALTDGTVSGQGDLEAYYDVSVEGLTFHDLDLSDMTFDQFSEELQSLGDENILLLLSVYGDNTGTRITFDEGLEIVLASARLPVYHPYYHGLNDGVAGGKVISHHQQGKSAGEMALSILNGTPVNQISPLFESPNPFIFDKHVLEAYDLPEYQLPVNTILLNDSPSLLEQYSIHISVGLLVLFIEAAIIGLLIQSGRARQLAERQLRISNVETMEANKKLSKSNQELTVTNEELTATYEELENQNKQIHDLIYVDSLTSLHNRYAISKELNHMLDQPAKGNNVILFIDVDNFKNINDTYGHDFGDEVIKATGAKLQKVSSEAIDIGRFGGDEFLILAKGLPTMTHVMTLVQEIQQIFKSSIVVEGRQLFLTVSIGVVLHPIHGSTETELLKMADMALYEAKRRGRDRYVVFDNSMFHNLQEKLRFQAELKAATTARAFYLNFQPIITTAEKKLVAFEALIRWRNPIYGQVSPIKLIENAEELGLIVEIGEFVLRESCRFIRHIHDNFETDVKISINVSPIQLMYDNFLQRTLEIVEEEGCSPDMMYLEMTESTLMSSIESATGTIVEMRKKGFGIALDDFGTGYSSLRYFRDLPISVLKIDKAFIRGFTESNYNLKFVESILNIAEEKQIPVISEGVETEEEFQLLADLGCYAVQGYYFSRPLPEPDAKAYLNQNTVTK